MRQSVYKSVRIWAAFSLAVVPLGAALLHAAPVNLTANSWRLPTGKLLAFADVDKNSVVVRDIDEKVVLEIADARSPVLSPDGKSVAFTREMKYSSDNGLIYRSDLWIAALDGKTAPRAITSTRDSEYWPSWSPDSQKIVFSTRPETFYGNGYGLIEIINADGTGRHAITKNEGATQPSWSSDGKSIAFVKLGICRMDTNGRKRARLTDGYSDAEPTWSPDGKTIAYSAGEDESVTTRDGRDGPISQSTDDIYLIRASATASKKPQEKRITDGKFDYQAPVWSRDGKWILCESDKEGVPLPVPSYDESDTRGPYNLFAMKADGSNFRRATSDKSAKTSASWR